MLAALLFGHIATFVPCALRTHALLPASRSAGSFMRAGEYNEREHMRRQDWLKSAYRAALQGTLAEWVRLPCRAPLWSARSTSRSTVSLFSRQTLFCFRLVARARSNHRTRIHSLGTKWASDHEYIGKPSHSIERFMHECVHGMRAGGRRRVVVPPSSSLALFDDDRHAELEVKLVLDMRGLGAADFYVQRAGRWPFVKVATLLMLASLARDLFAFCASTSSCIGMRRYLCMLSPSLILMLIGGLLTPWNSCFDFTTGCNDVHTCLETLKRWPVVTARRATCAGVVHAVTSKRRYRETREVRSAAGTCLGRLSAHCGGSERLYGLVGIGG